VAFQSSAGEPRVEFAVEWVAEVGLAVGRAGSSAGPKAEIGSVGPAIEELADLWAASFAAAGAVEFGPSG
jgi:hypothetical protein